MRVLTADPRFIAALAAPIAMTGIILGAQWLADLLDTDVIHLALIASPSAALGLYVLSRRQQPERTDG